MAVDDRYGAEELPALEGQKEDSKDVEIARLTAEGHERDQRQAASDARFDQMEKDVSRRFSENRQVTPPVDAMYAAQQELQIKDEELLDPQTAPDAIRRIASHEAQKLQAQDRQEYGDAIGNIAGTVFDVQMDRMGEREFFDDLEPLIREYFDANPKDVHVKGKIEEVYERLVGKNYEELKKRAKPASDTSLEATGGDVGQARSRYRQQSRVVDAPVQSSSLADRPKEGKKAVVLDEAREAMRQKFEGLGVPMTPEEYADIESGKKYPKKFAADIQVGLSKANVDYE